MRCERIGDAELYLGDCMEYMAGVDDKYFELSIVDPPYGIDLKGPCEHSQQWGGIQSVNKEPPSKEYFDELKRISQNYIIWGANYFHLPGHRCVIVWDKGGGTYGRSFSECEIAEASFNEVSRIIKIQPNQKDKIHPTQKPVALYKWLLSRYAKPGDHILDTHGGSGSSVVACIEMGYPIVWIEKDPDYYEAALDRIRRAWQNRPRLFEDNTPPTQGELL